MNRRSILRAASTRGTPRRRHPSGGKNLTEISATFSTGYKTAANIVPAATLKLYALTLVEFPIE